VWSRPTHCDVPFVVPRRHDSSAVAGYSPGAVSYACKEESASKGHEPVVARVPWYRTRRGIVVVVAILIVVIGALVGVSISRLR